MSTTGLKLSRISAAPSSAAILADFAELTKPGITFMVALTCIAGFYMDSVEIEPAAMLATAVGTSLLAAGASTVNQYIERSLDGLMMRTRNRPLPDGRLSPGSALRFGITLSVTGLAVLLFFVDALPAMLGFVTFLTYILLYTPLKRRTPFCTAVGAISGAMPPLIGSTAARGHIDLLGLTLFAVLFLWQMPHFFAIGWNYASDYARAGFRVASPGRNVTRDTVLYSAVLIPVSTIPTFAGITGLPYLAVAVLLGGAYLWHCDQLALSDSHAAARRLFKMSLLYVPALFLAMILNKH